MSILVMSQVWKYGPDDQGELLVLLALADHANDEGICWPSVKTIAEKARMSDRHARRIIRRLEESGHIETKVTKGGRKMTSVYLVKPTLQNADTVSSLGNKTRTSATETRTSDALNPDTAMSGEPSKNHQRNGKNFSPDDFWAESIRSAKPFAGSQVSAVRGRELIAKGLVTEAECRKAGVL